MVQNQSYDCAVGRPLGIRGGQRVGRGGQRVGLPTSPRHCWHDAGEKVEFFLQNTHWKHKENGKIRAQVFDVADFTFDVAEYGWISHIF